MRLRMSKFGERVVEGRFVRRGEAKGFEKLDEDGQLVQGGRVDQQLAAAGDVLGVGAVAGEFGPAVHDAVQIAAQAVVAGVPVEVGVLHRGFHGVRRPLRIEMGPGVEEKKSADGLGGEPFFIGNGLLRARVRRGKSPFGADDQFLIVELERAADVGELMIEGLQRKQVEIALHADIAAVPFARRLNCPRHVLQLDAGENRGVGECGEIVPVRRDRVAFVTRAAEFDCPYQVDFSQRIEGFDGVSHAGRQGAAEGAIGGQIADMQAFQPQSPLADGVLGRRAEDERNASVFGPDNSFVVVSLEGDDGEFVLVGARFAAEHETGFDVVEGEGKGLHLEGGVGHLGFWDDKIGLGAGNPVAA